MPLAIAELMKANHYRDRFGFFIIYGESGVGKSVYSILALKELGLNWKRHLFFRPDEFLARVRSAYDRREKIKALVVDDAGLGLFAYNWNNKFVKAFVKFINVARTIVSNIILTTPNPSMVVKKLLTLDAYYVKVMKLGGSDEPYRRLAKGYKNMMLPSGSRMVKLVFEDDFHAHLPDEEYYDYLEYRYGYAGDAISEMMRGLSELLTNNTMRNVTTDSNA